jgi:glycosyltransferase involved in cell wall biosynthesis
MRVLMLVPQLFYSARGTPLSAYHRTRELIALGHEVEILTYGIGDPPPEADLVVHRARGPHFARSVKQGPSHLKIWFDVLLAIELLRLLRRESFDVLWGHEEGGLLGVLAGRWFRIPAVYDMHSSLPLQIRDWGFSSSERVVSLFRAVERVTLRGAAASISIAPALTRAAHDVCPEARVATVLNRFEVEDPGDDDARGRVRRELEIGPDERLVLYTGSFVALQALDLLLEAVPLVLREAPEARFVLVGGRPEEVAALSERAAALGVAKAVRILAHRPQSEMPAFLAASDVLVSPRVQGINPPGKLFTYLQAGKPIVATARPIHDQILDERCAVLTRPCAAGIAEGIVGVLRDPVRAQRVVLGARELLRTEYHPDRRREGYEQVLRWVEEARARR